MKTLIAIYSIFFCLTFQAQVNTDVVLTDFIRESQQWVRKENKMTLSWWIPNEYWRIALSGNKDVPTSTIDKIEAVFENYVLICATDMSINSIDGSTQFTEEASIRKTLIVIDKLGKKHYPLSDNQISEEAKSIAKSIEPLFVQTLGQMGKGMHLYFFNIQNDKKENLINATKTGNFKVEHTNCEFNWALPMTTLLPAKSCPTDNEKMKGNWNYCPIHGTKLN